jgi:hypothetical protein
MFDRPPGPIPAPDIVLVPVLDPARIRAYGAAEANGETGKVEAFADDTTPMGRLDPVAINYIETPLLRLQT